MGDSYKSYITAAPALTGVLFLMTTILGIVSFSSRTRNDPARRPFTWMKISIWLTSLACLTFTLSNALYLAEYDDEWDVNINVNYRTIHHILEGSYRSYDVAVVLQDLGLLFLLLCIVDLGLSFLYVWNRSRSGHTIIVGATAFLALALTGIAFASFGEFEHFYTTEFEPSSSAGGSSVFDYDSIDLNAVKMGEKLSNVFDIAFWALSVLAAAFTIYIFIVSRRQTQLRRNAAFFLAAGILLLLRSTYTFAATVKWWLVDNQEGAPQYVIILQPILDLLPTFAALAFLNSIGSSKTDGIWSNDLPYQADRQGVSQQGFVAAPYYQQPYQPPPQLYQPVAQQNQHLATETA